MADKIEYIDRKTAADNALREAELEIEAILHRLEIIWDVRVQHVNINLNTRNFTRLSTEIILEDAP